MVEGDDENVPDWIFEGSVGQSLSPEVNHLSYTNESIVKRVYKLGRIVSAVFEAEQLQYWTTGGTTLGIVRHKGLIPWDDDLDLCLAEKEEDKLLQLRDILRKNGVVLWTAQTFGYRLFHETDSEPIATDTDVRNLDYRYPFCDIFIMKQVKNKYCPREAAVKARWPEEYYFVKDIELCEEKLFGDFFLRCPGRAELYLTRMYGPDWRVVGRTHDYDHRRKCGLISQSYALDSDSFYEPAKPFS